MDRNSALVIVKSSRFRRSLRGNVDRNMLDTSYPESMRCRSLRGNVDRNGTAAKDIGTKAEVVPYVGTWIEIRNQRIGGEAMPRRSLRGNVDRNLP